MIIVTLQLRSARGRQHDKNLGTVLIANDGTGNAGRGHYNVVTSRGPRAKKHHGRVENFPRDSRSALELLRRALNAVHENGELL